MQISKIKQLDSEFKKRILEIIKLTNQAIQEVKEDSFLCRKQGCWESGLYSTPLGWYCKEHKEIILKNDKR